MKNKTLKLKLLLQKPSILIDNIIFNRKEKRSLFDFWYNLADYKKDNELDILLNEYIDAKKLYEYYINDLGCKIRSKKITKATEKAVKKMRKYYGFEKPWWQL